MPHPLFEVVQHLQEGSVRTAYHLLHSLEYDRNTQTREYIFADALKKKLDFDYIEQGNIYFGKDDDQSHIDIFDAFAKLPAWKKAYEIGNQVRARYITESNLSEVAYLDLGLGKGNQAIAVMEMVGKTDNPPHKFTCLGLEPVADSMKAAGEAIKNVSKNLPFEVDYIGINKCAEDLTFAEWQDLRSRFGGKVAINVLSAPYCERTP